MHFDTGDFLHKWGFEDGDLLMSLLHDHGFNLGDINHNDLLRIVLEERVLPKIRNVIQWRAVSTMHNPVRITSVDGTAIDHLQINHPEVKLVPGSVEVPDEVILSYARRLA